MNFCGWADKSRISSIAVLTSGDFGFRFCLFTRRRQRRSNFERRRNYLRGIKTLATFEDVRNQLLQDIKVSLEKVSLTVDQAACLVDLLDVTVWGSSVDELKAAATPRAGLAADNVRQQQQDYTLFLHYISPSMWKAMESLGGQRVLEKLCQHAALLGLKNPGDSVDLIFWFPWASFG